MWYYFPSLSLVLSPLLIAQPSSLGRGDRKEKIGHQESAGFLLIKTLLKCFVGQRAPKA